MSAFAYALRRITRTGRSTRVPARTKRGLLQKEGPLGTVRRSMQTGTARSLLIGLILLSAVTELSWRHRTGRCRGPVRQSAVTEAQALAPSDCMNGERLLTSRHYGVEAACLGYEVLGSEHLEQERRVPDKNEVLQGVEEWGCSDWSAARTTNVQRSVL